jgi:hypothetical protein
VNSRGGFFDDRIQPAGILPLSSPYTGWGGNFLDFDNDGDLDLFIANGSAHFMQGMPPLLVENRGDGTFVDARTRGGPLFRQAFNARGSGALDFDNDGRMDLLLTTLGDRAMLWHNVDRGTNHWLSVQLEGRRCNRDGFGAQVRVTVGARTQQTEARCPTSYVFQQDPRLHFGLGGQASADRIEVRWPGGATQTLTNITGNRVLRVVEPGEGRWPSRP